MGHKRPFTPLKRKPHHLSRGEERNKLEKNIKPHPNFLTRFTSFLAPLCLSFLLLINGCATTSSEKFGEGALPKSGNLHLNEYVLGPGDRIEITVYRHDELNKTFLIGPSGRITYPLIGDIQVANLSIFTLRDKINDGLSKYIITPQVGINISSAQSQKIFVLGEVNTPGIFTMDRPTHIMEAILNSGGFTRDAKQGNVFLIRGDLNNPELQCLNIKKLLKKGDTSQNVYLQRGDIVYVPVTTIANVARFMVYVDTIIRPFVEMARIASLVGPIKDSFSHREGRGRDQVPVVR
jgi:polysaccharide export outer membrane protein